MTTKIIVTVDTEEEGLWSDSFRAIGNTVENVKGIPAFQMVCDNHQLAPVYLVNSPVVSEPKAVALLKTINDQGRCEVGTHIHPWNTPPAEEGITSHRSYLNNLEPDVQRSKLKHVTEAIRNKFGEYPTSFRAGRYGLDIVGARILQDLGYQVDSSVCPFTDYSGDGGPDFRGYPWTPYFVGDSLMQQNSENSGLLEVPVSFGFNWSDFASAFKIHEMTAKKPLRHFRLRGIFSRLGLLNKIKFSPEKHGVSDLIDLAKIYASQECPALVMMFHSSSLVPGFSPYVTDTEALKRFLDTIDEVLDYCISELDMECATLSQFALDYNH